MRLVLMRLASFDSHSIGAFYVNGVFVCFMLEDVRRFSKVKGSTRIPPGIYKVGLRSVGGVHNWLAAKFSFHKGSLHLLEVPGFEYILIHPGNTSIDTMGCLLPGLTYKVGKDFLSNSGEAYSKFYTDVANAILEDKAVTCQVVDELIF